MRLAMEERGRDPEEIQVVGALRSAKGPHGELDIESTMNNVPRLLAAGVTDFRIAISASGDGEPLKDRMVAMVSGFRSVVS